MPTISEEIEKQKSLLKEKLTKLESADVTKLETERQKHVDAIDKIDSELAEIRKTLGIEEPAATPQKSKAGKKKKTKTATPKGIVVTLDGLKKHIKSPAKPEYVEDGKLSIRAAGIDTATVKALVEGNPGVFGYEKSAYPKVWLLKK